MSETNTTTTTTTPPAATTTPPAQTTTPPPSTPQEWTATLGDDLKGYVQTKGFKEPKDVVESYRNFEKLQGVPKDRLLALPENMDTGDMAPIWDKLGKPKEAKEYNLEVPKENADQEFIEWAKNTFHKSNMTRQQAESFMKDYNQYVAQRVKQVADQNEMESKNQQETLKKEWGAAYDQNLNIANQAALKFGMTKEDVASLGAVMGPKKAMQFLHNIGQGLGEMPFHSSGDGSTTGIPTPDQARSEINQLINDTDFRRRLSAKETEAINKWNRLHQFANPGSMTI